MDQDLLQKRYDQLYKKVLQYRKAESAYRQYKASSDWKDAVKHGYELDQLLKKEAADRISKQQEMF